jgi:hypothetical protein
MTRDFDPFVTLRVLIAHDVRFVLIGGVAGNIWGSPAVTQDVDICYERKAENYERLVLSLRELRATLRGAPDGIPFILDARSLKMGDTFTFKTDGGDLDCLGTPSGTAGYADLLQHASEFEIDPGFRIMVASIDDLIRMKRAAGRPKDRIAVEILSALKEEREKLS